MNGCMTLYSVHDQVYNAKRKEWQAVSQEMMAQLKAMAQGIDAVDVDEGCCPVCNVLALASFSALYAERYERAVATRSVSRASGTRFAYTNPWHKPIDATVYMMQWYRRP